MDTTLDREVAICGFPEASPVRFLANHGPEPGTGRPQDTGTMWLIYGVIAMSSTVMLILARGWIGKDFKTRAN